MKAGRSRVPTARPFDTAPLRRIPTLMTYCVGLKMRAGLVMLSDTRTNAGVDNISTYRKTTLWGRPGKSVLCLTAAGNLAITQAVVNRLRRGLEDGRHLDDAPDMVSAAEIVGESIRAVHRADGPALEAHDTAFNVTFLLGGQIRGGEIRLFQIYSAGNFIEAMSDTHYLQIGEHKYGKPILDRVMGPETRIHDAIKLAMISMDSTLRSNLSVGMPIDLTVIRTDTFEYDLERRIDETDPYFLSIRQRWSEALRAAYLDLPDPEW